MAKFEPYKKDGYWTIDTDPDDILDYVGIVSQWMLDNSTTGVSYTVKSKGLTVLRQDPITGPLGDWCPVRLKVTYTDNGQPYPEAFITFHVKTADEQEFDRTIKFNKVEN